MRAFLMTLIALQWVAFLFSETEFSPTEIKSGAVRIMQLRRRVLPVFVAPMPCRVCLI